MRGVKIFRCAGLIVLLCATCASAVTNLVVNGMFAQPDPGRAGVPLGWAQPDGVGVQWALAPDGQSQAIGMDTRLSEIAMNAHWTRAGLTNDWFIPHATSQAIADSYGLSYYSAPFAVASGVTYRVTCDVWGPAGAKVWVRGYGLFQGQLTRRYESVLNCYGSGEGWRTCTQEFNPTRHRPEVTEMRVMLYAYHPAGLYWFRKVRVEAVAER